MCCTSRSGKRVQPDAFKARGMRKLCYFNETSIEQYTDIRYYSHTHTGTTRTSTHYWAFQQKQSRAAVLYRFSLMRAYHENWVPMAYSSGKGVCRTDTHHKSIVLWLSVAKCLSFEIVPNKKL